MLDRKRPYEQVFGIPGVTFSQDGRVFNSSGHPVTYRWEDTGEMDRSGDPISRCVVELDREPAPVVKAGSATSDLEQMHWKTLKVILDQYGEPFTSRENAIAFLKGRR